MCEDGFAVIDDAMPRAALAAALAAAERLRTDGKMRHVGQDGRDDDIAVLAVGGLPKQTSPYAGISAAARFLAAIPDALRARAAEHAAENADVKGADVKDAAGDTSDASTGGYAVVTSAPVQVASGGGSSRSLSGSRAEATMSRLAAATAPERLMLAHYPGGEREGARYVPHLDNDPDDPGHREGEPGLRACDRAVTAILYLNPRMGGGARRVFARDARGRTGRGGRRAEHRTARLVRLPKDSARGATVVRGAVGDDRVDQRLSRRASASGEAGEERETRQERAAETRREHW